METRGLNNPADQSALALQASVDDLETRLTAARAGYLDNLSAGAVATATALAGAALSKDATRYLSVTADFTSATWNDFGTTPKHEVFAVTGLVRLRLWIACTGNVDSLAHGATICFGHESDTDAFIAATDETELDSGDLWYDATPTLGCDTFANTVMDYVSNGLDVGYELAGEALTTGALVFHCLWEPLNATGAVVAGAGGAL